jgi:hypothetical protein
MNDSSVAKLVVTVIVLIGFAVWLKAERDASRGCSANCPTDISASRRYPIKNRTLSGVSIQHDLGNEWRYHHGR